MKLNELRIGIIHSLIGKNDGVSIVIDQTVEAMSRYLDINLGNFFFLAAQYINSNNMLVSFEK